MSSDWDDLVRDGEDRDAARCEMSEVCQPLQGNSYLEDYRPSAACTKSGETTSAISPSSACALVSWRLLCELIVSLVAHVLRDVFRAFCYVVRVFEIGTHRSLSCALKRQLKALSRQINALIRAHNTRDTLRTTVLLETPWFRNHGCHPPRHEALHSLFLLPGSRLILQSTVY